MNSYEKEKAAVDKFLSMSEKDFDKYMCEKYNEQFVQRYLPMNQTCMCWGFCIGKGWYYILDSLCSKYNSLYEMFGIKVIFTQIKEKFGSARFYYSIDTSKSTLNEANTELICNIIDDLCSIAEEKTVHVCSECGCWKYELITVYGWVYPVCQECFEKLHPERTDCLKNYNKSNEIRTLFEKIVSFANEHELNKLNEFIENFGKDQIKDREAKVKKL